MQIKTVLRKIHAGPTNEGLEVFNAAETDAYLSNKYADWSLFNTHMVRSEGSEIVMMWIFTKADNVKSD